jgi:parallel beta-helix repeat protein
MTKWSTLYRALHGAITAFLLSATANCETSCITAPSPPATDVRVYAGQSIQAAVDANPPGTAFVLAAGTHVRQTVIPKNGDTFTGEAGTVMDGEGVTRYAFTGHNGSTWVNNVTIRRIAVTRYAPPAQMGAIRAGGHDRTQSTSGWVLDSLDVHHNANLGVRIGNRIQVLRSNLHHNGTINLGGVAIGALVDGVESAYGNSGCPNDPGFEAGGSKFAGTESLIVRNSFFHHNCGPGLWLDSDNINYVLENNRVEDNAREGIVSEISYRGVIRHNVVSRNGWPTDPFRANGWGWDAGIGIHASSDVEVYGNTVEDNFNGIIAIQQNRGSGAYGPYLVQNLYVHDNRVKQNTPEGPGLLNAAAGAVQDVGDNAIFNTRNNRFQNNTYYLLPVAPGNSQGFQWANAGKSVAQWKALGQDVKGTFNRRRTRSGRAAVFTSPRPSAFSSLAPRTP